MRKTRILLFGEVGMELSMQTPTLPAAGTTVANGDYQLIPAHGITFTAIALQKLGAQCVLCGKVGNDMFGLPLVKFYQDQGVDTRYLSVLDSGKTAMHISLVAEKERRDFDFAASSRLFSADELDETFQSMPDAVVLKRGIPVSMMLAICEFAKGRDIPVFFDVWDLPSASITADSRNIIPILGIESIRRETGSEPNSIEHCLTICRQIRKKFGTPRVVLQLGSRGCFLYDTGNYNLTSPCNVTLVDETAAADSFIAAFAHHFAQTASLSAAANFATAVFCKTAMRTGGAISIPDGAESASFAQAHNLL